MEETLTKEGRIQIILHEYDTLRNEIRDTMSVQWRLQTTGISVLVAAFGFAHYRNVQPVYIAIPLLIMFFLVVEARMRFRITCIGLYIGSLEEQVNAIADEQLLKWESRCTFRYHRFSTTKASTYLMFVFFAGCVYLPILIYSLHKIRNYIQPSLGLLAWGVIMIYVIAVIVVGYLYVKTGLTMPRGFAEFLKTRSVE